MALSTTVKMLTFAIYFITAIHGYNNGVGRVPFMGWNTWCTDATCGYDVCNDNEIKEIAQAMLSNGMYDVGYRYIDMDDCWLACNRTSNGSLYAEPTRFPNGMANMIEYVHTLPALNGSLKFGLYTDIGTHTCSGGHRNGCHPPGLYGHYQQDANTLAAWKTDLIKFDGCSKPSNESSESLNKQFSVAVNKSGRHMLLEIDGTGYPSKPLPSYIPEICQAWKIVPDHHDEWSSTKSMFARITNATIWSGSYQWAYFDFLMTGGQGCAGNYNDKQHLHCPGQTDTEYMTEFALFAIGSSPLLVATDIRNMTDIMKKILLNTEIIAVNQEDSTPAGNLAYYHDCSGPSGVCQVWSRKLNDTSVAVVLFNIDDKQHGITVEFDKIGMNWNSNTKVSVRDLWEHKDIGDFTGSYDTQVVAHGNFFGKLTKIS